MCFTATSSTTNLTWNHPEINPVVRGYKPLSNRLSYDNANQS
jgi:hypothetical protein